MKKEFNLDLNKIGKRVALGAGGVGLVFGVLIGVNAFYNKYYMEFQSPVILQSPILVKEREVEVIEIEKEPEENEKPYEEKSINDPTPTVEPSPTPVSEKTSWRGLASWYGSGEGECLGCSPHYREDGSVYYKMANGQILDDNKMTVAFNRVPIGSKIRIRNLENNMIAYATVTDTGGFENLAKPKIVDVTKAVKNALSMGGVAEVEIELIAQK